jgi:hypothetical protein
MTGRSQRPLTFLTKQENIYAEPADRLFAFALYISACCEIKFAIFASPLPLHPWDGDGFGVRSELKSEAYYRQSSSILFCTTGVEK